MISMENIPFLEDLIINADRAFYFDERLIQAI
jgi:hypothetical protein